MISTDLTTVSSRPWLTRLGIATLVGLILAGCASSSHTSAGSSTSSPSVGSAAPSASSTPTAAASSPSKSTLIIGAVSDDTAPTGNSQDFPRTLAAWQQWVNNHGGINGHPVKVIEKDAQSNPALGTTIVHTLVEQNHVIALIDNTHTTSAWLPYIKTTPVPVICGAYSANGGGPCTQNADFFPAGTSELAIVYAQPYVAHLLGAKAFGSVQCSEVPACAEALPLDKAGAEAIGMRFVYGVTASVSAPNFTAQCLGAKAAGADSIFPVPGAVSGSTTFADDCAQQGYHPIWVMSAGTFNDSYLSDANYNDAIGAVGDFPWFMDTNPAQHEFRLAMGSHWPNFKGFLSPFTVAGTWAGAQLFAAAAAHIPDNPTPQDVTAGMYTLGSNVTLGGLTPPENFVSGQPTNNSCFYVVGIKNHQFVAPYGNKTFCVSSTLHGVG